MSNHANMLKPLCVWFGRLRQLKWLSKAAWDPIVNVIPLLMWSNSDLVEGGLGYFAPKNLESIYFFAWLVLFIHISFRKITFCNINSFMINKTHLQKSSSASGSIAVESGKHGQGEQASRVRAGESVPHTTLTPIKTYCCATLNNKNNISNKIMMWKKTKIYILKI